MKTFSEAEFKNLVSQQKEEYRNRYYKEIDEVCKKLLDEFPMDKLSIEYNKVKDTLLEKRVQHVLSVLKSDIE